MRKNIDCGYSIIAMAIAALFLAGCGGIEVKRMVPESTNTSGKHFDQSLKIVEPIGGQKSVFGVQDYVENQEMHGALMGAFEQASLFSSVTDSGTADLELHTEIIEVAPSGGFNMTFAFVTQYWLVDTKTSEEIWRKGINARNEERVSETWSGAARAVKALEGAVRDNISRLIEELAKAEL